MDWLQLLSSTKLLPPRLPNWLRLLVSCFAHLSIVVVWCGKKGRRELSIRFRSLSPVRGVAGGGDGKKEVSWEGHKGKSMIIIVVTGRTRGWGGGGEGTHSRSVVYICTDKCLFEIDHSREMGIACAWCTYMHIGCGCKSRFVGDWMFGNLRRSIRLK